VGDHFPGTRPTRLDAQALREARPDFTLSAQDLFDEYRKDGQATHKKYAGKVIELTGVVKDCKATHGTLSSSWTCGLIRLSLKDTKVTKEGIASLRKVLPKVAVDGCCPPVKSAR
jgi:hypothetical protein